MELKFGKQKFCEQGFIYKYLVLAAISASLRQHKWLRSRVCRKNIDTSSRTLNIFTPLHEYSKRALVDFTKKCWYSLTIWKSHLISMYKTNSSWQQNKDDRALKRHDRPIWPSPPISLPPFYNHHCCCIVANCSSEHQKSGVHQPRNQYLSNAMIWEFCN